MKVNQIRTKTFNAATPAALDTAIAAWLQVQGEATYLSLSFSSSAGDYAAIIVYTT